MNSLGFLMTHSSLPPSVSDSPRLAARSLRRTRALGLTQPAPTPGGSCTDPPGGSRQCETARGRAAKISSNCREPGTGINELLGKLR